MTVERLDFEEVEEVEVNPPPQLPTIDVELKEVEVSELEVEYWKKRIKWRVLPDDIVERHRYYWWRQRIKYIGRRELVLDGLLFIYWDTVWDDLKDFYLVFKDFNIARTLARGIDFLYTTAELSREPMYRIIFLTEKTLYVFWDKHEYGWWDLAEWDSMIVKCYDEYYVDDSYEYGSKVFQYLLRECVLLSDEVVRAVLKKAEELGLAEGDVLVLQPP